MTISQTFLTSALLATLGVSLAACEHLPGGVSKIAHLKRPPATTIAGEVTLVEEEGFIVEDGTGSIFVDLEEHLEHGFEIEPGEYVKVRGVLDTDGEDPEFEPYDITTESGKHLSIKYSEIPAE